MRRAAPLLALLLAASTARAQDHALHVVHTGGDGTARPSGRIAISFDRPVGGRLDQTIDPQRVVHVEPAGLGRLEWRDPATIRFVSAAPIAPGTTLRFTVDTSVRAMDGSRLEAPYTFSVRVPGAVMLTASFLDGDHSLPLDGHVRIVYSAPIDVDRLARRARIEIDRCGLQPMPIVALRPVIQRPIARDDPWSFHAAGGPGRDTTGDGFRRVVELEPATPLRPECVATLILPTTPDDSINGAEERFNVSTASLFRFTDAGCDLARDERCAMTRLHLHFTAPVLSAEVARHVHVSPALTLVSGAPDARARGWAFDGVRPHTSYTVTIDSTLRDVDGRALVGIRERTVAVGDYGPSLQYPRGVLTMPRTGAQTIPIRTVNVGSVRVIHGDLPSLQWAQLAGHFPRADWREATTSARPETTLVSLRAPFNVPRTAELDLPGPRSTPGRTIFLRVEIASVLEWGDDAGPSHVRERAVPTSPTPQRSRWIWDYDPQFALLQLSDLTLHVKAGGGEVETIVTGVVDGRPRSGARVEQRALDGRVVARAVTDSTGVAHWSVPSGSGAASSYVEAQSGDDRVLALLGHRALGWEDASPVDPSRLGARTGREPPAAAVLVSERGIYRPGEMLYLEGIVRHGALGALRPGAAGERVRLTLSFGRYRWYAEDPPIHDTVLTTSVRGTVVDSLRIPSGARLGSYLAELQVKDPDATDQWVTVAHESLRVAEYRAPEFLVDTRADSAPHYGGDTLRVDVGARYLFGAPMGRAALRWSATVQEVAPWAIHIPGADGWMFGAWERDVSGAGQRMPPEPGGADSLGADGRVALRIPLGALAPSRPGRVVVSVAVSDLNRQVVTSSVSVPLHPARFYVLARGATRDWLWTTTRPTRLELRTVRPDGTGVDDVPVVVSVSRGMWIERDATRQGHWEEIDVRTDTVRVGGAATPYEFVPPTSGWYTVSFTARDGRGGIARTTLQRYATSGTGGWRAGSPYALPLVAESREVTVGSETHVAFDSPWDDADGWLTLEREGVLERLHLRVHRGANRVALAIAPSYVPNVFVSVVLTHRRASDAPRPDSAAQLLRAGYLELRVATDSRRLAVAVHPSSAEYGPGDSARFRVRVTDASGRAVRSGVTLWAVDEGVLALTGYTTPDPLALMYAPRPLGLRFWSTLVGLVTSDPTLVANPMRAAAAYLSAVSVTGIAGGNAEVAIPTPVDPSIPRSIFRPTAFFVADVPTDADGVATVSARLPDNVTTFHVFAIAVGTDDRFGSGDTAIVATRALVARPSLPRFVRPADTLRAGAVVNLRDGRARAAVVEVAVDGIRLQGEPRTHVELAGGRGADARFAFAVPSRDSAPDTVSVRLRASDGTNGDAVDVRLPVRPDFAPRMHTAIGALRGSDDVILPLPADIDPARSTLTIRFGSSPLPAIVEADEALRRYRYDCTEQLSSAGRAELALWRATRPTDQRAPDEAQRLRVQGFADHIAHRQRDDGAFRFWDDHEWSSPWLTAWAGIFLVEARAQGIVVDDAVLRRAADYLTRAADQPVDTTGRNRFDRVDRRFALDERVAAVDFLRRLGRPDVEAEDRLLAVAPAMVWEDRLRLATVLAARRDRRDDARALLEAAWRSVSRAGRRIDIPDSAHTRRTFPSHLAPAARLLQATLAIAPDHPLVGALVETVLLTGSTERRWWWSTQDYVDLAVTLAPLASRPTDSRVVRVSGGGRTLIARAASDTGPSTAVPLTGLLRRATGGGAELRVHLAASGGAMPIYYALSVDEFPSKPPVRPDARGIVVERWYERFDDGRPVISLREGELVRVRMRVTVPADRAFVAVEDPLPAGLEVVDLSLNTTSTLAPFVTETSRRAEAEGDVDGDGPSWQAWLYGSWANGWWSPWEHVSRYDDRVVYFARRLWAGSYTASYVARATTAGSFTRPPAHAEEMYDPAVQGRSDGGRFGVEEKR